jgi:hypothetical protein
MVGLTSTRLAGGLKKQKRSIVNRGNAESLPGWHVKVTVHSAEARDSVYCIDNIPPTSDDHR